MSDLMRFDFDALQSIASRVSVAYEGKPNPVMRQITQWNPYFTFWVLKQGRAELHVGDRCYRVLKGQWILVPPNLHRRHWLREDVELVSLSFLWNWPLGEPVLSMPEPVVGRVSGARALCHQARRAIRELSPDALRMRAMQVHDWLGYQREFHAFLQVMSQMVIARGKGSIMQPGAVDARLEKVLTELAAAPTAGPLPYVSWSRSAGIGREQIDRLAQKQLGMTLLAWRNRLLAREIRRRLLISSSVIKTVASDLGFVDSAHFNRWCKQHLGLRPSTIRGGGQV